MTAQPNVGELHGNLVDALGAGIVSGQLAPGQVLTLEGVSAEHGVSRSVAREAIRVLESMGMVASRRRVGITIQPAVKWNMFDPRLIRWRLGAGDRAAQLVSLSELRRGFEPVAAALAARRADPHQCRIMAAAVSDMVVHGRSGDLESYLLADKIFHRTLLEASGNEMFRALTDVVAEVLSGRTHHGMMPSGRTPPRSNCTTRWRARSGCGRGRRRDGHARDHRRGGRGGRRRILAVVGHPADIARARVRR